MRVLYLNIARRPLRDALRERFPARPGAARIRTRDAAVVATPARLAWVLGLPAEGRPRWLKDGLASKDSRCRVGYVIAGHGALTTLQWALGQGCELDNYCPTRPQASLTCSAAAEGGHLRTLQWLRANNCEWAVHTCSAAAGGGHLAVLQWLRANGCPWDADTCFRAAQGGHLATLQWARANGCDWNAGTCSQAAKGGHLAVLQWARANGCDWSEYTCSAAAEGGHLAVLQWARANGCDWDRAGCLEAAPAGSEVREWIHAAVHMALRVSRGR